MYAMYSQQMLKGQYGALELQSTISLVSFMTESDTHTVLIILLMNTASVNLFDDNHHLVCLLYCQCQHCREIADT